LALTYKILAIFYCNKGGRGENILRNIVGNKGGLGGGYCTIKSCNNAPFFRVENGFFFRHLDPSDIRPKNTYKLLKTPQNWAGGVITGNIVQYIAQLRGVFAKKEYYCAIKPRSETISYSISREQHLVKVK